MAKLSTILDQIDAGSMLLPEFQRGYVWNRDQVRGLMRSLYHGYPVGALLVWETEGNGQAVRGGTMTAGPKQLLLDGQQRVTTLYGVVRGRAPVVLRRRPRRVRGTAVQRRDRGVPVPRAGEDEGRPPLDRRHRAVRRRPGRRPMPCSARTTRPATGSPSTSTGSPGCATSWIATSTSRPSPAPTRPSTSSSTSSTASTPAAPSSPRAISRWPGSAPSGATRARRCGATWTAGATRATSSPPTGSCATSTRSPPAGRRSPPSRTSRPRIPGCARRDPAPRRPLPGRARRGRLGLDHDRVLMGRYAIPVISRHLHNRGGRFADGPEADKALYWYVHAALRGRFAGSTETLLAKDLETVDKAGIDGVITALARTRKGNLSIDAQDFEGVGRGSRCLPAALPARPRVHGSRPRHRPPARPRRLGRRACTRSSPSRRSRRPATAAPRSTRSPTSPSSPRRRP